MLKKIYSLKILLKNPCLWPYVIVYNRYEEVGNDG